MKEPALPTTLVYERVSTLERARREGEAWLAPIHGVPPGQPFDLRGSSLLLVEESEVGPAAVVRARSFANVDPAVPLVLLVPEPLDAATEVALRQAGALDVVAIGDELARGLARAAAFARRLARLREERARLSADLAHGDRLSAIGVLAAGVGHEINNPSSALLANTERIREDLEAVLARPRAQQIDALQLRAGEWLEALGDCISACRRIATIVRSLAVFSRRSDSGARPEPTNLNDEIDGVLRLLGRELRYQSRVEVELDPDQPMILTQPYAMMQVITNLVVNAVQALDVVPQDRRQIRIRTSHDDELVFLEVSDTGPGIPAEILPHIFDPFFTTKPVGQGTGLGLSISRELVLRAGGELLVETSPELGTMFRVVLPRPARVQARPRAASAPPPGVARLRVLVVDDDELFIRALERSLKDDFECVAVTTSTDAVSLVRNSEPFDALVTDIIMPGVNGHQLFEAIAALDPGLARRSIFLSGGLQQGPLEQAVAATGRPLISKPISARDLARRIRHLAQRP